MRTLLLIFALCLASPCNAQFISGDDVKHFAVGAVLSSGTYALVYSKTKNKSKAFWYSLGAATLAGLTKELLDEFAFDGRFDSGEMISTSFGGIVASTAFNIFTGKRKKKIRLAFKR